MYTIIQFMINFYKLNLPHTRIDVEYVGKVGDEVLHKEVIYRNSKCHGNLDNWRCLNLDGITATHNLQSRMCGNE